MTFATEGEERVKSLQIGDIMNFLRTGIVLIFVTIGLVESVFSQPYGNQGGRANTTPGVAASAAESSGRDNNERPSQIDSMYRLRRPHYEIAAYYKAEFKRLQNLVNYYGDSQAAEGLSRLIDDYSIYKQKSGN
jgi:hypothetical protein